MIQSTLRQTLSDSLWEQAQTRETRYLTAQDAARSIAGQAAAIATAYDFCRDESNVFYTPQGVCVQCALKLTEKTTGQSLSVVCRIDDQGDTFWFILDMTNAPYDAAAYVQAVQNRLEANRAKKVVN